MVDDKSTQIQLLSPNVLREHPEDARKVEIVRKGLLKEIGWHYWVDITWILAKLRELNLPQGATILDAGGGYGLLQFILAFAGYQVISVDFSVRKARFLHKTLFPINELTTKAELSHVYIDQIKNFNKSNYHPRRLLHFVRNNWDGLFKYIRLFWRFKLEGHTPGRITLYRADIKNMVEIQNSSVDAVVSCSVIEHMKINEISLALSEFCRVLKPGRPMVITTSASKGTDWFHEPSLGWCLSRKTLSHIFDQAVDSEAEFEDFDSVLKQYQESNELKKRIPSSYLNSDKNGMPWGIWNPVYVPVGIVKRNSQQKYSPSSALG